MSKTILTNNGQYFYFDNPEAHEFHIEEIAHALSHLCRYTGHTKKFYSVAQHSVLVSYLVPAPLAMWGLMHDAAEAYLGDVSSPLKAMLPEYKVIEHRVEKAIAAYHRLPWPMPPCIKEADLVALVTEKRDLMVPGLNNTDWGHWPNIVPDRRTIEFMPASAAKALFLNRYEQIMRLHDLY